MNELERLQRRAERERSARLEAERIAERSTRRLSDLVDELEQSRAELRRHVAELRTPMLRTWPGVLTVPIVGRFTLERAHEFRETILSAAAGDRARIVILEGSALGEIDRDALLTLGGAARALELIGCEVVFSGLPSHVARLPEAHEMLAAKVRVFAVQADAIEYALRRLGFAITPAQGS